MLSPRLNPGYTPHHVTTTQEKRRYKSAPLLDFLLNKQKIISFAWLTTCVVRGKESRYEIYVICTFFSFFLKTRRKENRRGLVGGRGRIKETNAAHHHPRQVI